MAPQTEDFMTRLVRNYFTAVDGEDIEGVLTTLAPDCRFTVETHGVALTGHTEIRAMFQRLWRNHAAVRHQNFKFVRDAGADRVAVQFQVVNTLDSGELVYKSNCNFFTLSGDRFSAVAVYMAGENTLDHDGA